MNIALFGATGFVGSYIIESLIENNYSPCILVRENSQKKIFYSDQCKIISGDIDSLNSIEKTIESADVVIYNIGIIREFQNEGITFQKLHFEGVKRCVDIAKSMGVSRFILMSANDVKNEGTDYQITKYKAEKYLKKSGLDYTIFRPSLIFGKPKLNEQIEFCVQLKKDILNIPFPAPLFYKGFIPYNSGLFKLTPIHVKNVADFFVKSITMMDSIGKTYNLGGRKTLTWEEILSLIAKASKRNKWKIPVPISPLNIVATLLEKFKWFPVTKDQLSMLIEGNTVSEDYFNQFGIKPIDFSLETLSYLN